MAARPPTVPSNDALRVLKRLAFSPSPTGRVIRAADGFCTGVSLGRKPHPRSRRTECPFTTQRSLHTVSNASARPRSPRLSGKSDAGNDPAGNPMIPEKRRKERLRHYSTEASWVDPDLSHAFLASGYQFQGNGRLGRVSHWPGPPTETLYQTVRPPRRESKVHADSWLHDTFNHNPNSSPLMTWSEPDLLPFSDLSPHPKKLETATAKRENDMPSRRLDSRSVSPEGQPAAMQQTRQEDGRFDWAVFLQGMGATSTEEYKPVAWSPPSLSQLDVSEVLPSQSVGEQRERMVEVATTLDSEQMAETMMLPPQPSQSLSIPIPHSFAGLPLPVSEAILETLNRAEFLRTRDALHTAFREDQVSAYHIWLDHMKAYTSSNDSAGWAMAEALYHEFCETLTSDQLCCCEPTMRLTEHLSVNDADTERLQHVLFPPHSIRAVNISKFKPTRETYRLAYMHVDNFCLSLADEDDQRAELVKILDSVKAAGLPPEELLQVPLLRHLINTNNTYGAHNLIVILDRDQGIKATSRVFDSLIHGYMSRSRWDYIPAVFNLMHRQGLTSKEPKRVATIFATYLDAYSEGHTSLQTFTRAVEATSRFLLVTDSEVSAIVVSACAREGRVDLIREWTNHVRRASARMGLGSNSIEFALRLGRAWTEIGASCAEIEITCQAIASGIHGDPFSQRFKVIALHIAKVCLVDTINAATGTLTPAISSTHVSILLHLEHLLERAQDLFPEVNNSGAFIPFGSPVGDVKIQIDATKRLLDLFRGQHLQAPFNVPENSETLWTSQTEFRRSRKTAEAMILEGASFLSDCASTPLPSRVKIQGIIDQHFEHCEQLGQAADLSPVKYLARRLKSIRRVRDALSMLRHVMSNPFVQSQHCKLLDLDFFCLWLELATASRRQHHIIEVLRTLLVSAPHVQLSPLFLDLLDDSLSLHLGKSGIARDAQDTRWADSKAFSPMNARKNELYRLRGDVIERYQSQMGSINDATHMRLDYEPWEVSQRKSLLQRYTLCEE